MAEQGQGQGQHPAAMSWRDVLERMMELGLGAALLTKEAVGKFVDDMVRRGSMTAEDAKRLAADMAEKGRLQKERIDELIAEGVERVLARSDLARRSQVEALERRIAVLEAELRARREGPATPPTPV